MQHIACKESSRCGAHSADVLMPHRPVFASVLNSMDRSESNRRASAYDQAFLTVYNLFKSPNILGQSRGFASPVATLTAPYAAFAFSISTAAVYIYTHAYQNRTQNDRSANETTRLVCTMSVQAPCGVEAVYDVIKSATAWNHTALADLRSTKSLDIHQLLILLQMKGNITISNTPTQPPQAHS